MRIDEAVAVPREQWPAALVADHLRDDFPVLGTTATLRDAVEAMGAADVDLLPVVDDGAFVGVVTTDEVVRLDEILGRAEGA